MADQYTQSPVYSPMLAGAESLAKSLPTVVRKKASPLQSFSGVREASGYYAGAKALPKDISEAFKNLGTVTTEYGGSTRYEGMHPGIDIANVEGTAIPTFVPGKVTEVKTGQAWTPDTPSFGNYVVVQDNQGNYHRYSHLKDAYVNVGQEIGAGEIVGTMGGTGSTYGRNPNAPGYHLDYRIFDAAKKYYNPWEYLGGGQR